MAREDRRLAREHRPQRATLLTLFPRRPSVTLKRDDFSLIRHRMISSENRIHFRNYALRNWTFETGIRRSGTAGDREVARRNSVAPDREGRGHDADAGSTASVSARAVGYHVGVEKAAAAESGSSPTHRTRT